MQQFLAATTHARTAATLCLLAAAPAAAQLSLQQALMLRTQGASHTVQTAAVPTAPATTEDALRSLADQAAVIFSGEVLTLQQNGGAMRIDLRVDDGIRGVTTGEIYTLREWAGLWTANSNRMRVGQRALFLLHAPSVGGYSSPVGGADGIIPLYGDSVSASVDLRWIAARVARTVTARADGTAAQPDTASRLNTTRSATTANGIAWPADATDGNVLGPDLRHIDTGLVRGLLRSWATTDTSTAEAQ